jgi:prepilin signal peptidase PulO-like enzyme (type II secretory pathway)
MAVMVAVSAALAALPLGLVMSRGPSLWTLEPGESPSTAPALLDQALLIGGVPAIWGLLVLNLGAGWDTLHLGTALTIMLTVAVCDGRTMIIPDRLSLGGAAAGVILALTPAGPAFTSAALGAAIGYAMLLMLAVLGRFVFRKEAMGGGDLKLFAAVGAFLGAGHLIQVLFVASLIASMVSIPIMIARRRRVIVPFGVYIAIATAIALIFDPLPSGWPYALAEWQMVSAAR